MTAVKYYYNFVIFLNLFHSYSVIGSIFISAPKVIIQLRWNKYRYFIKFPNFLYYVNRFILRESSEFREETWRNTFHKLSKIIRIILKRPYRQRVNIDMNKEKYLREKEKNKTFRNLYINIFPFRIIFCTTMILRGWINAF